jgi:hypothetical protein
MIGNTIGIGTSPKELIETEDNSEDFESDESKEIEEMELLPV